MMTTVTMSEPVPAEVLAKAHRQAFGRDAAGVWASPGRVNLIGEHTDYNDGFVLPFALSQHASLAASLGSDGYRFHSVDFDSTIAVSAEQLMPGRTGWHAYLAGVVWALQERGYETSPLDVSLTSDVPVGAGLSSSAAIECAMVAACVELFGLNLSGIEQAKIARLAENEFVGAPTGLMDQAASTLCTSGHALLLDCRSAEFRQVALDPSAQDLELLVLDTNTPHALVDSEYAARRRSCETAAEILGVSALRDVTELESALSLLDEEVLRKRVRHVVTENARVQQAVACLDDDRLKDLGEIFNASHASMRDDFEITVPSVDLAVRTAQEEGSLGARMTGGGFGGCIIALVKLGDGAATARRIVEAFAGAGYRKPSYFIGQPSAGSRRIA